MNDLPRIGGRTPMHHRTLGNCGAVVSTYALGTMTFGAEADESAAHAILDDYVAAGGSFVDTADVYSRASRKRSSGAGSQPTPPRLSRSWSPRRDAS